MTKTLDVPDGKARLLAPTTTTKMAKRMLQAGHVAANFLPAGFYGATALDILLSAYVAEEGAQYLSIGELCPAGGSSPSVTRRWVDALVSTGLMEQRGDLMALTACGHTRVTQMAEAVFEAQRMLD